ncbi:MAG: SMC-Scp complex subunit ScpB [Candidatus Jacksonbacteria bacterium]|nr:SMC-Scp complex subunit ScpB [Candidatus Jacksonbacteria bacterium]
MPLKSQIEALLAGSGKALSYKEIARLTEASVDDVIITVRALHREYEETSRGIRLAVTGQKAELVTAPKYAPLVQKYINKEEDEMTQAQIETLAILAYRGPLTRAELEDIRGVNCAVILRNLLIVGLIEERTVSPSNLYEVSTVFLKGIGADRVENLPEYEDLRRDTQSTQT